MLLALFDPNVDYIRLFMDTIYVVIILDISILDAFVTFEAVY